MLEYQRNKRYSQLQLECRSTTIITLNASTEQTKPSPMLLGVSGGTGTATVTASAGACQSSGGGQPTVQVPTYFFSPSETTASTPPVCTQENYTGYYLDVLYYVADANSTRISQVGIAPGENLNNGGGWHDAFATPTTTRADGSFDDVPRGACYAQSTHFCATGSPQSFRATSNGKVYPIATNTTS
jgi:hypothetical protein